MKGALRFPGAAELKNSPRREKNSTLMSKKGVFPIFHLLERDLVSWVLIIA